MGRRKSIDNLEQINKPETQALLNKNYYKPNFLIGAKYQSKLIDNQIIAISMANIKNMHIDEDGVPVIAISGNEIKNMIGGNDGSFYSTLARAANRMTKRTMGIIDPENGSFDFMAVITRARYAKGIFYIYYNPHFKKYLTTLNKTNPYTKLNLKIMLSFSSVYSFRLFELIKAQCYTKKGQVTKNDGKFSVYYTNFGLAELMFELGIVNSDSDKVFEILNHSDNPDYEKAITVISPSDKKYTRWDNFKTKVLDIAVKEINKKAQKSMVISYKSCKGKGGRVASISFTVKINEKLLEDTEVSVLEELTQDQKDEIVDEITSLIGISSKDGRTIATAANYNMAIIEEKYKIAQTQNIDNIVGWMISAITNDYSPAAPKRKSTKNFVENDFSYDAMESELLDNIS